MKTLLTPSLYVRVRHSGVIMTPIICLNMWQGLWTGKLMFMEINVDQYLFSLYPSLMAFLCVLVIICCFHALYCMQQASESPHQCDMQNGYFLLLVLIIFWKDIFGFANQREIPNLIYDTDYPIWEFLWFSMIPPSSCWDSTFNYVRTTTVNLFPMSPFTVIHLFIAI